jgi:hypothetical protein
MLYLDQVFTDEQYRSLMSKIHEGRMIDNMYDIKAYLIAQKKGMVWAKTQRAYEFRADIKKFVVRVERHFQDEGFMFYNPRTVH